MTVNGDISPAPEIASTGLFYDPFTKSRVLISIDIFYPTEYNIKGGYPPFNSIKHGIKYDTI